MSEAAPPADYPRVYLQCPVCRAKAGELCVVRSGRVVDGQADGAQVSKDLPHIARRRSARASGSS